MSDRKAIVIAPMLCVGFLAGCASDSSSLMSTSSISNDQKMAATSKINPVCVTLASQIDALRAEGTPERIKAVASGKSATANIKRSALAKLTELNTANAAFQQKCSTLTPKTVALITPAPVANAATKAAAATTAGQKVTSVAKTTAAVSKKTTQAVSKAAAKADKVSTAVNTATAATVAAAQ